MPHRLGDPDWGSKSVGAIARVMDPPGGYFEWTDMHGTGPFGADPS